MLSRIPKREFLTVALVLGVAFLVWVFRGGYESLPVEAGASANLSGWAWSDMPHGSDETRGGQGRGGGWISFNSTNCDPDGVGGSNGSPPACPPVGTGMANYGVHIDPATGNFSGYAWSEHLGWVRFDPPGPYPEPPDFHANLNARAKQVSGWARACAVFQSGCSGALNDAVRGGWDGWIKLRGKATDPGRTDYGISWSPQRVALEGWAWGGDIVGWISFSCRNQNICPPTGPSNYGVRAVVDTQPPVVNIDQPNGVLNDPILSGGNRIRISATDALTDVVEGEVQISLNDVPRDQPWTKYDGNLLTDFDYTASRGNKYEFCFKAKDEAGNWSACREDGALVINNPPGNPAPNAPPPGSNTFIEFPDFPLNPILRWSGFTDPDGAGKHAVAGPEEHVTADVQKGYDVEIASDSGFAAIVCPREGIVCSQESDVNSFPVPAGTLRYDVNYYWRVRVRDDHNLASEFARADTAPGTCKGGTACAFHTPPSSPPVAQFTFVPQNPSINEVVQFTDESTDAADLDRCPRGGCHIARWEWDFGDGKPVFVTTDPTKRSPTHVYTSVNKVGYEVKLKVTDDNDQTKEARRLIKVRPELPEFKEVLPR